MILRTLAAGGLAAHLLAGSGPWPGPTHGNRADLYVSPTETLPAIEALVDGATRSLDLEVFNFGTGYGQRLAPRLVAKARSGVAVRLLVDEVGSRFLAGYAPLMQQLRRGGVQVQVYSPYAFRNVFGHPSFNVDHRKLFMADGRLAMVGGVNLASPFESTTQDAIVAWRGPVVAQLAAEFKRDWLAAGGRGFEEAIDGAPCGDVAAQVAVTSPRENRYEVREAVFRQVDAARESIVIEQQYVWDEALLQHLEGALRRGVSLKLLIPGPEQKGIQRTCNAAGVRRLQALGAVVHDYHGPSGNAHLHTKYFAVDEAWAAIGSCNGDTRSMLDNQELDVITTSPALVLGLRERLFEPDWRAFSRAYEPAVPGFLSGPLDALLESLDYYL